MRIPQATYRIQFTPDFGFRQAEAIIGYLADLGISDLYASPVFKARQGSEHGYDLVDPTRLNPELGSFADFESLSAKIRERSMGWLQDIVPNHMAFDAQNPYLADIFENGPSSRYYEFFDIDWEHYYEAIQGKVLAPFLGRFYGHALEAGELRLAYAEDGFAVSYYDLNFPLKIESYLTLLTTRVAALRRELGEEQPDYIQFLGILYVLQTLNSEAGSGERPSQVKFIKQNLWTLYKKNPVIRQAIDAAVEACNGRPGEPESFNFLEVLLAEQWFRLAFWKVASEEINYRRFFSINDLISVKVEEQEVFAQSHALIFDMLEKGHFTGLRIDHIDGLYDPAVYLQRLRRQAPQTYLVAEKILGEEEPLPPWPIQGTTGYDFMNAVNGVFCQTTAEKIFTARYRNFTGMKEDCAELVYAKKKLIIERYLFGDVNNLAHLLKNIASRHRYGSDITMDSLKQALIEVLALFPVYRSYIDAAAIRDEDRRYIETAIDQARERNPGHINELDFIGRILLGQLEEFLPEESRAQWLHFSMRFQQVSGPLMAKGFEDTFLYVYNRLLSLNEVGGHPEHFGLPLDRFHAFNRDRRKFWPQTMNATASHDTKRGEDVRARLNVLSEIPQEWGQQVRSWSRLNRGRKITLKRRKVPDKNDEYFLYQTLIGALPFAKEEHSEFVDRLKKYLIKAVREAKVHTAWLKPDDGYEEAFLQFAEKLLSPGRGNAFLPEFLPFQRRVAHFGMLNSLAQTLLKITAPGIPDFYQGTEFWDLSLVDPDNRRPVDYAARQTTLQQIIQREETDLAALIRDLLADMPGGRVKLFLIHRSLTARNRHPDLFEAGDYLPLPVSGPAAEHVIAFARRSAERTAVTVVPRLLAGWLDEGALPLGPEVWADTKLGIPPSPGSGWQDAITGDSHPDQKVIDLGRLLKTFPVALLVDRSYCSGG